MASIKKDLSPIRIVKFLHGCVALDDDGVNQVIQQLNPKFSDGVVILSIVGPRGSGKSFFLNLMLKYLRSGGKGDWFNDLSKKKEPLEGFATADRNDSTSKDFSGVYLWPEFLTVEDSESSGESADSTKSDFKKVPVILLDTIFELNKGNEGRNIMDMFLCMVSTKVIINSVNSFKPDDLLPLIHARNAELPPGRRISCNQVGFLVRDSEATSYGPSKAMPYIDSVLQGTQAAKFLADMNLTEACLMKKPDTIPVSDDKGCLNKLDTGFIRSFKTFMNTLLDSGSLIKGETKIDDFRQFLGDFVDYSFDLDFKIQIEKSETETTFNPNSTVVNEEGVCMTDANEVQFDRSVLVKRGQLHPAMDKITSIDSNHSDSFTRPDAEKLAVKSYESKALPQIHSTPDPPVLNQLESVNSGQQIERTDCNDNKQHKQPKTEDFGQDDGSIDVDQRKHTESQSNPCSPKPLEKSQIGENDVYKNPSNTGSIERHFPSQTNLESTKVINPKVHCTPSPYSPIGNSSKQPEAKDLEMKTSSAEVTLVKTASRNPDSGKTRLYPNLENENLSLRNSPLDSHASSNILKSTQLVSNAHRQTQNLQTNQTKPLQIPDTTSPQNNGENNPGTFERNHHSYEDKQRFDHLIQAELTNLKGRFAAELVKTPPESGKQLVERYVKDFQQFLDALLPCDSESKIRMLEKDLTLSLKVFLSKQKPRTPETATIPAPVIEEDKMDCTPPPPNPIECGSQNNQKEKQESNSEPMDTDQTADIIEKIQKRLKIYRKDLDDFIKNINMYAPSSTQTVEKKLEELGSLCCQQIGEEICPEGENSDSSGQFYDHVFNSILKINDDFTHRLQSAREGYESCLKSLHGKLEDAAKRMTSAIVNGQNGSCSSSSKYYEVLKNHMYTVQQKPSDLIKKMLKDDTQEFLTAMTFLEEALVMYRRQMVKHLEMYKCMSDKLLSDFHLKEHKDAQAKMKSDSSFFRAQLANGIKQMYDAFTSSNQQITATEHNLVLHIVQNESRIKNFYNDMMKEFTKATLWTPSQLKQIHEDVVDEICTAFKLACNFHPDSGMDFTTYRSLIRTQLSPFIESFQQQNIRKGDKLLSSVSRSINDHKRSYNYKMEDCLKKAGGSMNPQEFERHHSSILTEVCNSLKFELQKMEGLVDYSSHVTTLKKEIEADWADFKEGNEKKLKLIETKEWENQRNKKAEEAAMKQKAQAEERQQRGEQKPTTKGCVTPPLVVTPSPKPPTVSTTPPTMLAHTSKTAQTELIPHVSTYAKTTSAEVLKPIAIEFGFHFIRVGWIEPATKKYELLKNEWDEEATPSVVALTKDGEILVGSEATRRARSELEWKFSMSQIILEHEKPNITFGYDVAGLQQARKELLMGHMLSKVKGGVEKRLNGRWETVVLTVPLWYSSVHRQAARDAATIAGFKNIHLINETSAAAMSYANFTSSKRKSDMILVAVCSDSYFDAAVYTVKDLQLRMESSCGNNHSSIIQSRNSSLSGLVGSVTKGVKNFFRKESKSEVERTLKEMVGELNKSIQTCVCVNTNSANSEVHSYFYREVAPLLIRCCKSNCSNTFQAGDAFNIVEGAAEVASLLDQHKECRFTGHGQDQILMQNIVQDKLTYNFDVSNSCSYDRKSRKFVEYKSPLINAKGESIVKDITLSGYSNFETGVTITEGPVYVGSLTFLKPEDKEVHLKGILSNEGILRIELVTGTKHNWEPVEFTWSSHNMRTKEVQDMTEYVKSLQGDSEEEKLLKQIKQQLNDLLNELRPKLDTLQGIKKAIVTKSVEEAAATVGHSSSTIVMMQNKIEQLVALRSKYAI